MSEQQNVELVKQCYEAFGRGDVAAILASVTEDVEWEGLYGAGSRVPSGGLRRGPAGVADFFKTLAETVEFHRFEPREFVATGASVVALGSYKATVRGTGKSIELDWVMHFGFENGRMRSFREYTDSAAVISAYQ